MNENQDRCAFGSWCPKRLHARLWCAAKGTGTVTQINGNRKRMCAEHGPIFATWDIYGGQWASDEILLESPLSTQQLACGNRVPVENPITIRIA